MKKIDKEIKVFAGHVGSPVQGAASAPVCPDCNGTRGHEKELSSTSGTWVPCPTCCRSDTAASAAENAYKDAMLYGTGAFRVAPDGSATHFVITDMTAASASDQGAAVKLTALADRLRDALPACPSDSPDDSRELWSIYTELRAALAERAQAAQPTGAVRDAVTKAANIMFMWAGLSDPDQQRKCYKRIMELATPAPEQEAAHQTDDEAILRRLLAFRVAGAKLYGDDGELQDNTAHPFIDFKRDSAAEIEAKLDERGRIAFAALDPEAVRRAMSAAPVEQEAAQVAPPGAQEVQNIMFEVFEYAKLSEGIDKAEGEARAYQRDAMLQQDRKIRNMIAALTAPVPATTPAEQTEPKEGA